MPRFFNNYSNAKLLAQGANMIVAGLSIYKILTDESSRWELGIDALIHLSTVISFRPNGGVVSNYVVNQLNAGQVFKTATYMLKGISSLNHPQNLLKMGLGIFNSMTATLADDKKESSNTPSQKK